MRITPDPGAVLTDHPGQQRLPGCVPECIPLVVAFREPAERQGLSAGSFRSHARGRAGQGSAITTPAPTRAGNCHSDSACRRRPTLRVANRSTPACRCGIQVRPPPVQ